MSSKDFDREESKLARIARESRVIASQAETLSKLERALPNYIDSKSTLAIIAADTLIFENYNHPERNLEWLNRALSEWLRANQSLNLLAKNSIFHRYVVLPYPAVLGNWAARANLIKTILLNVHLQLWHGIICGIIFADPRRYDVKELVRVMNFAAVPAHRLIFDVPGFYRSISLNDYVLEGQQARRRLEEIKNYIVSMNMNPVWLFYDEQNFGGTRLSGWRWNEHRRFFNHLYQPGARCLGCGVLLDKFALDHIAPFSKGHFQTILNFQLLCGPCNSKKRALEGSDPYVIPSLISESLRTRDLEQVFYQKPPWVGLVIRPGSKRELFTRNLGLS
jgi:HNH endonuclease